VVAGSLLLAAPIAAQQRDSVKTRSEVPMKVYINGRDVSPQVEPFMQRRARLGITVNLQAKETDSLGAFIQSVTPGGPASQGRHSLRRHHHEARRQVGARAQTTARLQKVESAPGVRLIEMAAKLDPGDHGRDRVSPRRSPEDRECRHRR
jgi:hypothetical protein